MKRILLATLLVSIPLLLREGAPSFAQESAQQKAPEPSWQTLSEGVWKTDLGADRPEVVILKMSNEEFEKFHASKKAARAYIDDHHFLKRKLLKVVFIDVVYAKNGQGWWVCVPHSTHSTAGILAWQIPQEKSN